MNDFLDWNIGLLIGGWSAERDVCVRGGHILGDLLSSKGHRVTRIMIDDPSDVAKAVCGASIDLAVLSITEDVPIQGILTSLSIPFIGSGILTTAVCFDKGLVKRVVRSAGLLTPPFEVLDLPETGEIGRLRDVGRVVVKPSRCGSSKGVSVVDRRADVEQAILSARAYDTQVIVEKFIPGVEVSAVVLDHEVLALVEVDHDGAFYDYGTKTHGSPRYHVPARVSADASDNLRAASVLAGRMLGCRGLYRVDFIVSDFDQNPYLLEINTLPYLPEGEVPAAARYIGITLYDLLIRIFRTTVMAKAPRPLG